MAYIFDFVSCPIKLITGFPCPGCGITRATISLFKFRFYEAFYYCVFRRIQATYLGDCRPSISAIVGHFRKLY